MAAGRWLAGERDDTVSGPRLGIRENAGQFALLVAVNGFVGGMVGLERAILPALAEENYGLAARSAILGFIVVFGLTKAATNWWAGRWSERWGRKPVLVAGWLVALPVPVLLMLAPSWSWVIGANALLGVSQGLTWSTTVIMKIDLAGPRQRGLAMGLNESAGYLAVGLTAVATAALASRYGLGPVPFALGLLYAVVGLGLSVLWVRETRDHVQVEAATVAATPLSAAQVFRRTSFTDRDLSAVTQAGLVNNLNDGLAWGLFPLVHAAAGLDLVAIGWLAGLYPAVWGLGQLVTGAASDRWGRKPLIVAGMVLQALAIAQVALGVSLLEFAAASVLLGVGTALVYPTLLAAIGDVADPRWRASAVGAYRLWRDTGYAVGAVVAGALADQLGLMSAVWVGAGLTLSSGLWVVLRLRETLPAPPGIGGTLPIPSRNTRSPPVSR